MGLRTRIMEVPLVYDWFQHGLGRPGTRDWFADQVLQPRPGQRILDIGCGTATVIKHLSECNYVGIDHNPEYINKARKNFGTRGEFHCIDINDAKFKEFGTFDTVLLLGVLHHLNDDEVKQLVKAIPAVLKPSGMLVTMDPALVKRQHPIARLLAKLDRGRYVRSPKQYRSLIEPTFTVQEEIIRHDLLKVPYTHAIYKFCKTTLTA
jgi:2-polyprenyl-3-methyl-5-hydroxy-6-metoxy-1,4-benzoquinol methylase